jgi:hypothetical protein
MKLTRKQIKDGLDAMPIDKLLLGHNTDHKIKLTAKQMKFAEEVAKGTPKAKAYRKAYDSNAKPSTQARNAHELSKNSHIQAMIEAQKVAIEAQKYQTPAHLRALTIHELTKHALDAEMPPAQRIKCLELLGKITEVALFTERREVIKVETQEAMREKLVNAVKLAIGSNEVIDATYTSASDLLAELHGTAETEDVAENGIVVDDAGVNDATQDAQPAEDTDETTGGTPSQNTKSSTPRTPAPQKKAFATPILLHSNPHIESPTLNESQPDSYINQGVKSTVTGVIVQGEGGINISKDAADFDMEEVPPNESESW